MRSVATAKFRHKGMGKSIPKGRLCQRGKGPYLTTFHLPSLNPLPLLKYSHALLMPLPMQASCLSSLHSQHHRALGNHRLCHRLPSSCLALLASLPHRLSSLVCHTGCHLLHGAQHLSSASAARRWPFSRSASIINSSSAPSCTMPHTPSWPVADTPSIVSATFQNLVHHQSLCIHTRRCRSAAPLLDPAPTAAPRASAPNWITPPSRRASPPRRC